ncbi:MAG TPA: hypothetical protein VMG39_09220 [Pseudolabrys sp.]|nr:hypothetical protein [Pseudolabrys sp.]
MRTPILTATLIAALALPAHAATYPVSGHWGQSASSVKGAIDCTGKRVIAFSGDQRTDSQGGVPAYRNKSVRQVGVSRYRVVDVFTNGQINNAQVAYTLTVVDADHVVMSGQTGTLKLQRCQ